MADANASMSSLTDSDRCATAFRLVLQLIEAADVTFDNRIGVLNKIKETWERNEDVNVMTGNEFVEQSRNERMENGSPINRSSPNRSESRKHLRTTKLNISKKYNLLHNEKSTRVSKCK
ncbi:uncharacterized protein LOC110990751 isoform X3 [Acanthaster planci]|nr:uncharacterized protein LOC110990751 isoform X3 [Acanthaster planci]